MSAASSLFSDERNRRTVWLALAVVAIGLAALWGYGRLVASRDRAAAAAAELADCRGFADAIVAARRTPSLAASDEPQTELNRRIERAAKAAKLPGGAVAKIGAERQARLDPQTVRRSRQVDLRGVTLRQAMTFLHALTAADPGLTVADLRLTAPLDGGTGGDAGDRWAVEANLAYQTADAAEGSAVARASRP